jgi:hypothetical protein
MNLPAAEEGARKRLLAELREHAESAGVQEPGVPTRLFAITPDAPACQLLETELSEYFAAVGRAAVIPPWSPLWEGSPRVAEWRRARHTYVELTRTPPRRDLFPSPERDELNALGEQHREAMIRGDQVEAAKVSEREQFLTNQTVLRLFAALRARGPETVDVELIDGYVQWWKAWQEMRRAGEQDAARRRTVNQPEEEPLASGASPGKKPADRQTNGQRRNDPRAAPGQPASGKRTAGERSKDIVTSSAPLSVMERLGLLPGGGLRKDWTVARDGPQTWNFIQRNGLYLSLYLNSTQMDADLPGLAEWLYAKGCKGLTYECMVADEAELKGETADDDGVEDEDGSPRPVKVAPGVWYALEDGERRQRESPGTFLIPPRRVRDNLQPGQLVRLLFDISTDEGTQVERLWVVVIRREGGEYAGELRDRATSTVKMHPGTRLRFEPRHVIAVPRSPAAQSQEK